MRVGGWRVKEWGLGLWVFVRVGEEKGWEGLLSSLIFAFDMELEMR